VRRADAPLQRPEDEVARDANRGDVLVENREGLDDLRLRRRGAHAAQQRPLTRVGDERERRVADAHRLEHAAEPQRLLRLLRGRGGR